MLVVPVKGDKVKTKDDSDPRVVTSFTSLKDEPAVYLNQTTSRDKYLYFSDLIEINGVSVEYDSASKTFKVLGPLKRKYNLPQPGDVIVVKLIDVDYRKDEVEDVEVASIKLHNKKYGIGSGLLICGSKSCFTLPEILDVKHEGWTEAYDQKRFEKYYADYCPLGIKIKS